MNRFLFLLLLTAGILSGQTQVNNVAYNIEYNIFYNTESPVNIKANLIVDSYNQRSIFIEKTKTEKKKAKFDSTSNRIVVRVTSKNNLYNLTDFRVNKIKSLVNIYFDDYLLVEEIPNFNWVLLDSTKTINGEKLNMARTSFRGRNYIAWYNENLPMKFGPWKFNGLPGLIYQVYDETKRYNWTIKSIKKVEAISNFFSDLKENNLITLREYSDLSYGDNNFDKQLLSKLPRGAKVKRKSASKRNGIEIEFEWEK